jgi:CrcB protein
MVPWVAVALGGALGSVLRHGVNRLVHQQWPLARYPWGTLAVNLVGCLVIGTLAGLVAAGRLPMRASWREFVFVGILGGFTTFSTFGLDTITLIRTGDTAQAFANVAVQVGLGLLAVYLGLRLGELVMPRAA